MMRVYLLLICTSLLGGCTAQPALYSFQNLPDTINKRTLMYHAAYAYVVTSAWANDLRAGNVFRCEPSYPFVIKGSYTSYIFRI